MRLIIFLFFAILFISCNQKTKTQKPAFLIGKWERLHEKDNKQTFEIWKENFTGLGYTLKEKDTIFKEILSIISINDTLVLKVVGVNEKPTLFKITSQTDTSFVAENPTHDFPKKIIYWLEKNHLKAEVSDDKFSIDFIFKKIN